MYGIIYVPNIYNTYKGCIMNDAYTEDNVKQLDTPKNFAIRLLMILACIVSFMIVPLSQFLIVVPVIVIWLTVFIFGRLKVEYEYIYADGQIDFDRISGNAKRKNMMRIDLDNCEVVAPVSSDAIKAYNHNENIVVKNFSSLDPNARVYAAITNKDGTLYKILFEPSDETIKLMRNKAPQKVKEY